MRIKTCSRDVILIDASRLNSDIFEFKKAKDKRSLAVLFGVYTSVSPSSIHHARARYQTYMQIERPDEELNLGYGFMEERYYLDIINGFGFEDVYRVSFEEKVEEQPNNEPTGTIDYTSQLDFIQKTIVELGDDLAISTDKANKEMNNNIKDLQLSISRLGNCMMQMLDYMKAIKDKVTADETSKKAN